MSHVSSFNKQAGQYTSGEIPMSSDDYTETPEIIQYPMKVVRKFDKVGFRMLKKLCRKFMQKQKDEYLIHQTR